MVVWHAVGAAVITYVVAAVPAMFFVTGSLLAKSFASRPAPRVVVDRLRRALIPFWVFAAVVWAVLLISHAVDGSPFTAPPWRDLVFWVLPFNDPHGSVWEGGYATAPLWYLRALLWVIVASPVLWWMIRRGRTATLSFLVAGIGVLEYLYRTGRFTGTVAWRVGDGFVYGLFVALGFVHRQGVFDRLTRLGWSVVAFVAGAGAAAWLLTQPVADHVVNDSHPAHVLVGLTWLAVFMAARPVLVTVASTAGARRVVGVLSRRSLTVYLWHPPAIVITYLALRGLGDLPAGVHTALLLAGTTAIVVLAILVFGWVEDLANRRPARLWPLGTAVGRHRARPRIAAYPPVFAQLCGAVAIVVLAVALLPPPSLRHRTGSSVAARQAGVGGVVDVGAPGAPPAAAVTAADKVTGNNNIGLRVPSQQPKTPGANATTGGTSVVVPGSPGAGTNGGAGNRQLAPTTPVHDDRSIEVQMAELIEEFVASQALPGVQVAIHRDGDLDWAYAGGTDLFGKPLTASTRYDIASATKSLTGALVWQAIDKGLIDPDAPLPSLTVVPSFPYSNDITVRQLLAHKTGLVNYRSTPGYDAYGDSVVTPELAVEWSGDMPLEFDPGSRSSYSSVNYLVLGLVLEQVEGRSYGSLLTEMLNEAGLRNVRPSSSAPGLPNFSASGVLMTASELAHWGSALLDRNTPQLSSEAIVAMENADRDTTIGEGLEGYCPCSGGPGGVNWTAFGYAGSVTLFEYAPASRLSIAVNLSDSLYEPEGREDATLDLIQRLRVIVG